MASPVHHFRRTARKAVILNSQEIKAGDKVVVWFGSGNRDEAVFDRPFEFDPTRSPNRHIGFGYGAHICLGQHLARLEMKTFWEELLPRLEHVEMAGEGKYTESEFVSGPKSVPVRFRMR